MAKITITTGKIAIKSTNTKRINIILGKTNKQFFRR